jgi:hypothetical protein
MTFKQFESECIGIAIDDWPHLLIGIYSGVDGDWGKLSPIDPSNPLSKQWKSIDSDMYIRLKDVKLIKIIKYVEIKQTSPENPEDRYTGKSAIG